MKKSIPQLQELKTRFGSISFHPVVHLPKDYQVFDFSKPYDKNHSPPGTYGVGKYNEKRVQMYTQEIFAHNRDIHVGIDLSAPTGTPVYSFYSGEVFLFADNNQDGDYGPTIITRHLIQDIEIFALYGHLSRLSLNGKTIGQKIDAGDTLGWIGEESENGNWKPHLHFQLSLLTPEKADLPGVVSSADLEKALQIYPDPQLVLGKLY